MGLARILVVDDEKNILGSLKTALTLENFDVEVAGSGKIALEKVTRENFDLALVDVKMPGMDGLEVLREVKIVSPLLPVVMMSGHGTIQTALEAIKNGAEDFIEKPLSTERLILTIKKSLQIERLVKENELLKSKLDETDIIIGDSEVIRDLKSVIDRAAPTDSWVLIQGENGTGKELVARAIHEQSSRAGKPFVKVNCAAIPSELIESELFGHVKGAFTGAMAARRGKFELADTGTIFLDEIGDMKLELQSKLLRVLQESEFEPVGGERTVKVDVRVLSATNKNLEKVIAEGGFRKDLYYRLAVIPVHVKPLRDRISDIPALVQHFARIVCAKNNFKTIGFSEEAIREMQSYDWPGNVRELKNTVERLIILSHSDEIRAADVVDVLPKQRMVNEDGMRLSGRQLKDLSADFEKMVIEQALERNDNHVTNTAKELGLERSHLYKKMRAHGIAVK